MVGDPDFWRNEQATQKRAEARKAEARKFFTSENLPKNFFGTILIMAGFFVLFVAFLVGLYLLNDHGIGFRTENLRYLPGNLLLVAFIDAVPLLISFVLIRGGWSVCCKKKPEELISQTQTKDIKVNPVASSARLLGSSHPMVSYQVYLVFCLLVEKHVLGHQLDYATSHDFGVVALACTLIASLFINAAPLIWKNWRKPSIKSKTIIIFFSLWESLGAILVAILLLESVVFLAMVV